MREIKPKKYIRATLRVPGSKSYTQRALAIAALAKGTSVLSGGLISEDTLLLIDALRGLGVEISINSGTITVCGSGGALAAPPHDIYLGNNGTALRFLTTMSTLTSGDVTLTGVARLLERPVGPLVLALRELGVAINYSVREGFPPLTVKAEGLRGGRVRFSDLESSQYISSLLISAPYAQKDIEIELAGQTASRPYIALTVAAMKEFGVNVLEIEQGYRVAAGQRYRGKSCPIEGDASSASYFFLAAALTGGTVEVSNLPVASLQGDLKFLDILTDLGCRVGRKGDAVTVYGRDLACGDYQIDMGDIPDLVPTLAVLAAFRNGQTRITNCAHLKHKESDRLAVLAKELSKMGISARQTASGLDITGGAPRKATICAHGDHRIAMAFAIAGLCLSGMKITGDESVNKSFPNFWEELERL